MALGIQPEVREIVMRVCARSDVLEACRRRDLGAIIAVLNNYGVTQGKIAELTGIPQGRLSEYKTGRRTATAVSIFVAFADGIGMPLTAREALGLAADETAGGSIAGHPAEPTFSDVGLMYPDIPSDGVCSLSSLWQSDLADISAPPAARMPRASRRTVLLAATALAAGAWKRCRIAVAGQRKQSASRRAC
jgi:hypothetical protein